MEQKTEIKKKCVKLKTNLNNTVSPKVKLGYVATVNRPGPSASPNNVSGQTPKSNEKNKLQDDMSLSKQKKVNMEQKTEIKQKCIKLKTNLNNTVSPKAKLGYVATVNRPGPSASPNNVSGQTPKSNEKNKLRDDKSLSKEETSTKSTPTCRSRMILSEDETPTLKVDKADFTLSLVSLLNDGELKMKEGHSDEIGYLNFYFHKHKDMLRKLIFIIWDNENMQMCKTAVHILYQIVIDYDLLNKCRSAVVKGCINCLDNFSLLLESLNTLHERFSQNQIYKQESLNIRAQLLRIITTLSTVESCSTQIKNVSEEAVQFIGSVLIKGNDYGQTEYLLEIIQKLCHKKQNCKTLCTTQFLDVLRWQYNISKYKDAIFSILTAMSKNKASLNHMASHRNTIYLILEELLKCVDKDIERKHFFLSVLEEATRDDYGLTTVDQKAHFSILRKYFTTNRGNDDRDSQVVLYTILNRSLNKIVLPDVTSNVELYYTMNNLNKKCPEYVAENESEYDSDDSDSNNEDYLTTDEDVTSKSETSCVSLAPDLVYDEPLPDMMPFFAELLYKAKISEVPKFNLFDDIIDPTDPANIDSRVGRLAIKDKLAYPDRLMLKPFSDKSLIDSSCNTFPLKHFGYKLDCDCGLRNNLFIPNVVFDLDKVPKNGCEVPGQPSKTLKTEVKVLQFDSCFECGNLQKAIQINNYEYDLIINPDISTRGVHWFYFQISSITPKVRYVFNIINYTSIRSMYNSGRQPLMFSEVEYKINGTGWTRAGENITHFGNQYVNSAGTIRYKTLCFGIEFHHDNDCVYFSSHYPYTYTRLMATLAPLIHYKSKNIYARIDKLCDTSNGLNEVPIVTITAKPTVLIRPLIFITGRIHPGESNSSWIVEGVIKFLLEESDEANVARQHFIFKIIPMINPEGVVAGNTRLGLTGVDLNRSWTNPNKSTCMEVYFCKKLIEYVKNKLQHPIAAYLDIHGHSRMKNACFYACNPMSSWNKDDHTRGDRKYFLKFLPETVASLNEHISLSSCSYNISKNKEQTGRVVMWREFGIESSYTLECSFSEGFKSKSIDTKILCDIGASVIAGFARIAAYAFKYKKLMPTFCLDYRNVETTIRVVPETNSMKKKEKNKSQFR